MVPEVLITMALMASSTDLLDVGSDQHVQISTTRDTFDSSAHDDDDDHRLNAVDG